MKNLEAKLRANAQVSDYKINSHAIKSYELFFVKGKLETVRSTKTCDTEVTIYVEHNGFLGDAQFLIYPSTTEEMLDKLIAESIEKALLIRNQPYTLPENEEGKYTVESNFSQSAPEELAAIVANAVFSANNVENGSLNSVEIFINQHTESVLNSRGIRKSQVRYDAMVEAIPTYNGADQSVELYEQYNFSSLDTDALVKEISEMMTAVVARYESQKPSNELNCKVILNKHELSELFSAIANNLNYRAVYSHATMFSKGDAIQTEPVGDKIGISMVGEVSGNVRSSKFDSDGLALGDIRIVDDGIAVNYFGDNRFGQYLNEKPTGSLRCIRADVGSVSSEDIKNEPYLEVISMSGLQVDFFSDYIGGEVRLAYYYDGEKILPVTGISISGSIKAVLNEIRFSSSSAVCNGYIGPEKAILSQMKIF